MLVKYKKRPQCGYTETYDDRRPLRLTVFIVTRIAFGAASWNFCGFSHLADDFDIDAGEVCDGGIKELAEEWLDLRFCIGYLIEWIGDTYHSERIFQQAVMGNGTVIDGLVLPFEYFWRESFFPR